MDEDKLKDKLVDENKVVDEDKEYIALERADKEVARYIVIDMVIAEVNMVAG